MGIDPGPERSAWVVLDTTTAKRVPFFGYEENEAVVAVIRMQMFKWVNPVIAIEQVSCYGMPVGQTTFDTCRWIGHFQRVHMIGGSNGSSPTYPEIATHFCHKRNAKESAVRAVLIDRWGGKEKAIGNKKSPGPLYGLKVKYHHWSALAVAVYVADSIAPRP